MKKTKPKKQKPNKGPLTRDEYRAGMNLIAVYTKDLKKCKRSTPQESLWLMDKIACVKEVIAAKNPESQRRVMTEWKAHLPALFKEILKNPGTSILVQPLKIIMMILGQVAERAIALDDPELNALMLRLALFEQGDPYSEVYDPGAVRKQYDRIAKQALKQNAKD